MARVQEMGNDERQPPFFFQKAVDALLPTGGQFPYPLATNLLYVLWESLLMLKEEGLDNFFNRYMRHGEAS